MDSVVRKHIENKKSIADEYSASTNFLIRSMFIRGLLLIICAGALCLVTKECRNSSLWGGIGCDSDNDQNHEQETDTFPDDVLEDGDYSFGTADETG
jgi:hypothetical protein